MRTELNAGVVTVSWNLATDNGSPITAYQVFIRESGSTTFTLESSECDGTENSVISSASCTINISTLNNSPYNIDGGDSIWAKVTAANIYGTSELSVEGNGAIYTRIPDAPISL